ncbi:hypothetical protein D3C81_1818690 [compost metagenome]
MRLVGDAVGALAQRVIAGATAFGHGGEAANVQAGTEGPALAMQDDRAHIPLATQSFLSVQQRLEHRRIERIHLVGAVEFDLGDTFIVDIDQHAFVHHATSPNAPRADCRLPRHSLTMRDTGLLK